MLTLETRGRHVEPLTYAVVRELTETDVALLLETDRGTKTPPLARIRARHHAIARLVAVGTPDVQIAVICGLTAARIGALRADPTFKELVDFYHNEVVDEYRTMHGQLAGIGEDALAVLRERLEDEPEKMSNTFLLDLVTKVADRTGNGPTSTTNQNVNVTVDLASRLKAARERAREAIEATAKDITPKAAAE
jgi:hypothetical protein